jgi:hypothetical protein
MKEHADFCGVKDSGWDVTIFLDDVVILMNKINLDVLGVHIDV